MGLLMNTNGQPTIYENSFSALGNNQEHFTINPIEEWMTEQKESVDIINHQLDALKSIIMQEKQTQANQWQSAKNRLDDLLENEHVENLTIRNQVQDVSKLSQEIVEILNKNLVYQEELTKQISSQEEIQQDLLKRLDKQEGLTEKVLRQMDFIRSILYERTNFLAEKIENSYSMTSSYMARLFSKSTPNGRGFIIKEKKEDKQENID
ncbi:hypothetical protein ACXYMX_07795 [Sporosarcina sp. CAU 1771]